MARVTISSLQQDIATLKAQIEFLSVKHPPLAPTEQAKPATQLASLAVDEVEIQSRHPTQPYCVETRKDFKTAFFLAKKKAECGWTSRVRRGDEWVVVRPD
jgi:hypothetical protein